MNNIEEKYKSKFVNHVASFTDYGKIKILDFKAPNTSEYRIRFLFEEDYCRLHISGDLGELIATNYNNMTYEKFSDFVDNTGYFEGKIDCCSRALYYYDDVKAKEQLMELAEEYELYDSDLFPVYDSVEEFIDEVLYDFSDETGIGKSGYELLSEHFEDVWEVIGTIGKSSTNILDVYMLAFKLAKAQLSEKE